MSFTIKEGSLKEAHAVSLKIPEFNRPYYIKEYKQRLDATNHLVLVAYDNFDSKAVGFKIGYEISSDVFYSWMGGVMPNFRRNGIAASLANYQEEWAHNHHYTIIQMKTRKKHKAMIVFSQHRGFEIKSETQKKLSAEKRLIMEKTL